VSAQTPPELTNKLQLGFVASDQGRLTTLPGTGCAGELRTGADLVGSLTSGGILRTYRLHMPVTAQQGVPTPVVLNFHALASNGQIQEDLSGLRPLSDREGFILVSPDGAGSPSGWNALLNESSGIDDVAFVNDLIDELQRNYCVDVRRVYATGFSSGGMMASRLGCELGSRIAAVAPVAGVYAPEELCAGVSPMLAIHGTGDTVVPFDGGLTVGVPYPGARAALAQWAGRISHCYGPVTSVGVGPRLILEKYSGCGAETSLLVVEGLGHAPPDGAIADYMWSFLQSKKLPFVPR
jgi:polyhydroxybutyrate depolymerase